VEDFEALDVDADAGAVIFGGNFPQGRAAPA